ncbi:hypothetical protein CFP56_016984 [Quercus suber]|uniref:Uncharacterized protein n=1 Tax=Quercus suber TaxID=58331 RepID=A0AAW0KLE9_QUESU
MLDHAALHNCLLCTWTNLNRGKHVNEDNSGGKEEVGMAEIGGFLSGDRPISPKIFALALFLPKPSTNPAKEISTSTSANLHRHSACKITSDGQQLRQSVRIIVVVHCLF